MEFDRIALQTGERLDRYLAEELEVSRNSILKALEAEQIFVNEQIEKPSYRVREGDRIRGALLEREILLEPEEISLDILYEDDQVLVINKPSGLVVHPSDATPNGTLVNALLNYGTTLSTLNTQQRPGIVHRLDKDTTGALVIAKDNSTHWNLAEQFSNRQVKKLYLALVHGRPKESEGLIETLIGRNPKDRKTMAVVKRGGKPAITKYEVLGTTGEYSLIRLDLLTGRTHQIRVHLRYLGCPILGDPIYGRKREKIQIPHLLLHAQILEFNHPKTGERVSFQAELDAGFTQVLERLGMDSLQRKGT